MKEKYITIQSWMRGLGIGGNDLLAYALVFGFSQDGKSRFSGGLDYLMSWLGCNRKTACTVLARLTEKGLLKKREIFDGVIKYCEYSAIVPDQIDHSKIYYGRSKKDHGDDGKNYNGRTMVKNAINNKEGEIIKEENKGDNIYTPNPSKFNFRNSLINSGVSADTADQWLAVRAAKKLVNTELALMATMDEIRKSGHSAEQCIRECVIRSWGGFKAEWLEREQNGGSRGARPEKLSGTAYMIQQMERRQREQQGYDPNDLPDEQ